jgi:hypothetical protein
MFATSTNMLQLHHCEVEIYPAWILIYVMKGLVTFCHQQICQCYDVNMTHRNARGRVIIAFWLTAAQQIKIWVYFNTVMLRAICQAMILHNVRHTQFIYITHRGITELILKKRKHMLQLWRDLFITTAWLESSNSVFIFTITECNCVPFNFKPQIISKFMCKFRTRFPKVFGVKHKIITHRYEPMNSGRLGYLFIYLSARGTFVIKAIRPFFLKCP